ncbi:MAG: hypothetical protein JJ979_02525 [Roseibium sp.]|nr:hypothetical protein [Roseibium sp.]
MAHKWEPDKPLDHVVHVTGILYYGYRKTRKVMTGHGKILRHVLEVVEVTEDGVDVLEECTFVDETKARVDHYVERAWKTIEANQHHMATNEEWGVF